MIHEHYVTEQTGQSDLPAMQSWAELDETLRAQNRDQARDNISELHAIGRRVVAADSSAIETNPLGDADVLNLGIAEHDRWSHQARRGTAVRTDANR